MTNIWMLDVLADLSAFADQNGMPRLADRLVETAALAEEELAISEGKGTTGADDAAATAGNGPGRIASSGHA